MEKSNPYVYFVYRKITSPPLHCSDLIGKVGKGTGKRIDVYRTPYGTDDLIIDIWECNTDKDALQLEGIILDILDMRGWLRYHAEKNGQRKRSEVISFSFKGKNVKEMIKEYTYNMCWIKELIRCYHSLYISGDSLWSRSLSLASSLKGKISYGKINREDLSLFSSLGDMIVKKNMEFFFAGNIKMKEKDGIVSLDISLREMRIHRNGCCIM